VNRWRAGLHWAVAALGLLPLSCAGEKNVIRPVEYENEAGPAAIDQDAWALLPAGPIGWAYLDAPQLVASRFGPTLVKLVSRRIPALSAAGFDPARDIEAVHFGLYSIQGADVLGVATGRFDPERIEKAVEQNPVTPLGIEMTKTSYGGRTLYMAESSGFCVLTTRTAVFGNQMGMRRAIDRIRRGKLNRELPTWLTSQLTARQAPVVLGLNLKENPLSAATRGQLPFLNGMETLGVLANFQEPGLNLAGTAGYADEGAAALGAQNLEHLDEYLQSMSSFMALIGIQQPLRSLTAEAQGKEARFVAEVDGAAVDRMLTQLDGVLPSTTPAAPAAEPPALAPPPGSAP